MDGMLLTWSVPQEVRNSISLSMTTAGIPIPNGHKRGPSVIRCTIRLERIQSGLAFVPHSSESAQTEHYANCGMTFKMTEDVQWGYSNWYGPE